ncbi:MAG: DUF309 domain-containing protein [Dehalococcoidia bacterium]
MGQAGLPLWPSRGNRRRLDMLWLERLEEDGLANLRQELPAGPPPELYKAIDEFNHGLFWECHETLEHVWRATSYPIRHFYHGIIKLAVGFYHLSRHNRKGARAKLSEGLRLVRVFTPCFFHVDTEGLWRDSSLWLQRVETTDRIDWIKLDGLPTPQITVYR